MIEELTKHAKDKYPLLQAKFYVGGVDGNMVYICMVLFDYEITAKDIHSDKQLTEMPKRFEHVLRVVDTCITELPPSESPIDEFAPTVVKYTGKPRSAKHILPQIASRYPNVAHYLASSERLVFYADYLDYEAKIYFEYLTMRICEPIDDVVYVREYESLEQTIRAYRRQKRAATPPIFSILPQPIREEIEEYWLVA